MKGERKERKEGRGRKEEGEREREMEGGEGRERGQPLTYTCHTPSVTNTQIHT